MPRFFFDYFDGSGWSEDDVGLEFASAEQAYLGAVAGARGMWPDLMHARTDPLLCAFEIRDEDRRTLFRLDFTELLESCRRPVPPPAGGIG
jgi:hypothetical protein